MGFHTQCAMLFPGSAAAETLKNHHNRSYNILLPGNAMENRVVVLVRALTWA